MCLTVACCISTASQMSMADAGPHGHACREEREQRRNDIEHLATSLVGKVNECVTALDEGECWVQALCMMSGQSSMDRPASSPSCCYGPTIILGIVNSPMPCPFPFCCRALITCC
jgi:hypothetical protein